MREINKTIAPILIGLIALFVFTSIASADIQSSYEKTKCPFELISNKDTVTGTNLVGSDFAQQPSDFVNHISKININSGLALLDFSMYYGESIGWDPSTNNIPYSSYQYTSPSTYVDMQLQTGLQKKVGVSWTQVQSLSPVRSYTTSLSQSGSYHVTSAGTYRTVGCHKMYSGGVLIWHVDSYSGELTLS
jgi:hypothetical protein